MNKLVQLTKDFEGHQITTLTYEGRPCWIARELGSALGYARGGDRLITNIKNDWRKEFCEGEDFMMVEGKQLAELKALLEPHTESVGGFASHLILLFESGLYLALTKTNKPVGVRLRRFLATEVLPQIAREGNYLPERKVVDKRLDLAFEKERRLMDREQRLNRKMKLQGLTSLVQMMKRSGAYSRDLIRAYEVKASEVAADEDFSTLKPSNPEDDWVSPTQIAERFGLSAQKIGRVITILNLRGNITGLARAILNKAKTHDRTVTSYLYSPEAVQMIAQELGFSNKGLHLVH